MDVADLPPEARRCPACGITTAVITGEKLVCANEHCAQDYFKPAIPPD